MKTEQKILNALEEIRPYLQTDGGDIEFISVENNQVKIRFMGSCTDCSINKVTLKSGVEMTIKKHAPEIKEVISV